MPFHMLDGNTQGYSISRELAINTVAADPSHTLLHEIGHIVLAHTSDEDETQDQYRAHRGLMEFEAESTTYLTLSELGQQSVQSAAHSRGYIQAWLRDERPPDTAIRQVFSAVDTILKSSLTAKSPTEE